MQTGTGKCFDLVPMRVCVRFHLILSTLVVYLHRTQLTAQFESHCTGEVSLPAPAAAAPRLRLHVRNDHWHCRAEGVPHTHTHTQLHAHLMPNLLSQVSTKSSVLAERLILRIALPNAPISSLSLTRSPSLSAHLLLPLGRWAELLRLLFCPLRCSQFHFEWRRRFQGNFCCFLCIYY